MATSGDFFMATDNWTAYWVVSLLGQFNSGARTSTHVGGWLLRPARHA
jgi:hypothetical protein